MLNQNLQLANIKSRTLAFVLDDLIVTFIILIIFWDSILNAKNDMEQILYLVQVDLLLPLVSLKILYHTFFVWYYGATIGKIITKIRVIDVKHWGKVSFFSSLLRAIGRVFSEMFFYIGFILAFFIDGKKTFHDITGKTLIVNA